MGFLQGDPRLLIRIGMVFLLVFFVTSYVARRMPGDAIDLLAGLTFGIGAALLLTAVWRIRRPRT